LCATKGRMPRPAVTDHPSDLLFAQGGLISIRALSTEVTRMASARGSRAKNATCRAPRALWSQQSTARATRYPTRSARPLPSAAGPTYACPPSRALPTSCAHQRTRLRRWPAPTAPSRDSPDCAAPRAHRNPSARRQQVAPGPSSSGPVSLMKCFDRTAQAPTAGSD